MRPGHGRVVRVATPLVVLLLVWLVPWPLVVTAADTLYGPDGWSGGVVASFAATGGEWLALWRSLLVSLLSVAAAAAVGVPLAFLFARREFPGRGLLTALLTLPVALPPLVGVIAFLFLWGESGLAARAVGALLGLDGAPWRLTGVWAILLVHTYSMYVYFFLFTRAALAAADPSLEEAAMALGASRRRVLLTVTLPLLRPALAGAALLTFLTALASFSAPYIFGGSYRVMTTQIVASKLNGQVELAQVESLALAALALLALAFGGLLQGRAAVVGASHGVGARPRPPLRGAMRLAVTSLAWALALFLLLPHATLALLSLVPVGSWTVEAVPPSLSLENYQRLVEEEQRLRPVASSAWMATVASLGALVVGFAAADLARRRRGRWKTVLEGLVTLPWAVPGTVFAIALAATFAVDAPLVGRFVLVGTTWLLPLAYLLRSLPLTGRAAIAGLAQLDPALEEAAAGLGASPAATLLRVTLPRVWPALAAGLSLAFVAALGDFVTSILLYTYDNRPIAMEILSSLRLQETGLAAVYGVLLAVLSTGVLVLWGEGRVRRGGAAPTLPGEGG